MQDRLTYLELAKIAKSRGKLSKTLLRVYLMSMVKQYYKEQEKATLAKGS